MTNNVTASQNIIKKQTVNNSQTARRSIPTKDFQGRSPVSLEDYRDKICREPITIGLDAWIANSYLSYRIQRYDEALIGFNKIVAQDPANIEALIGQAFVLFNLKKFAEALKSFNKIITLDPLNSDALIGKSYVLLNLQRYEEALNGLNQSLALNPKNIEALIGKTSALFNLNRYNEALIGFNQIIALDPMNIEARMAKVQVLCNLKRIGEALESLDQITALSPNNSDAWFLKAQILIHLKEHNEALICLKHVIKPDHKSEEQFKTLYNLIIDQPHKKDIEASLNVISKFFQTGFTISQIIDLYKKIFDNVKNKHYLESVLWSLSNALIAGQKANFNNEQIKLLLENILLHFGQNSGFIFNTISELPPNNFSFENLSSFYAKLLKSLKHLNIDWPQRFDSLKTAYEIINNRNNLNNNDPRPLAVLIYAKSDWNSALLSNQIRDIISHGYRVVYFEARTDKEVYDSLISATSRINKKAHLLVFAGHGERKNIELAEDKGEKFTIDLSDLKEMIQHNLRKCLSDNGVIVLESCSTGEGKKEKHNIANMVKKVFPQANVYAPTNPTRVAAYKYNKWEQIIEVVYASGKNNTYSIK